MNTKLLIRNLLSILLACTFLPQTLVSVKAQSPEIGEDDTVSFQMLGKQDIVLTGPLDSQEITFRLPADWVMRSDTILHINLNAATGDDVNAVPGTLGFLEVYLNDTWLTAVSLTRESEYSVDISVPSNTWATAKKNASQRLRLVLMDTVRCDMWLSAVNSGSYLRGLSVVVRPSSYIDFKYDAQPVPTDLKLFPYPLYQNTFRPDKALIVIPDQPTQEEIQAAMNVSAALGRLTDRDFDLRQLLISQLSDSLIAESNLVFIGNPLSFPILQGAKFPAPYNGTGFDIVPMKAGDGILQMIVSPRNASKVWLLVSGVDGDGINKAARAVGSQQIQPYGPENLAIITGVGVDNPKAAKTDFTFVDLGYPLGQTHYGPYNDLAIWFDMPANQALDGAFFEMVFTNSAVLNFDESNVSVVINDNLVGSLRFSDKTSSITRWKFNIPKSILHPGRNLLLLEMYMSKPSPCIPNDELWFSIMPESLLHLPTSVDVRNPTQDLILAVYQDAIFSTFDQTALIVQSGDPFAWSTASRVAFDLGRKLSGSINLSVYYADSIPNDILQEKDLVLVGHPSGMPVISQLSQAMPAPFEKGSDIAHEKNPQYTFLLTNGVPVGYLQLFSSPWNTKSTVLAVLGNVDEGLASAATALLTSSVQKQMAGNFVTILNDKIVVQKIDMPTTSQTSPEIILPGASSPGDTNQTEKTGKINVSLPIIVVIIVVILAIMGVVVFFVMDKKEPQSAQHSKDEE